jgi:hypothetical protein
VEAGRPGPSQGVPEEPLAVCSAWLYVAEHGINKAIDNPFDALWWGVVTLTTVGYGDVTPVTTEGRIAAMALMLLGIGLFGAITATITSYLMTSDLRRVEDRVEADVALDKEMEKRTAPSAERTSSAGSSLVSELERLAALHDAGALTNTEVGLAKSRLVSPTERPSANRRLKELDYLVGFWLRLRSSRSRTNDGRPGSIDRPRSISARPSEVFPCDSLSLAISRCIFCVAFATRSCRPSLAAFCAASW